MQSGSTGNNVNSPGNSHLMLNSGRLPLPDRSEARSNIVRKHIAPVSSNFPAEGGKSNLSPHDKSTAVATLGPKSPTTSIHSVSQAPRMNGGSTSRTPVTRPRFDPMRTFRNSFLGKQTNDHGNTDDDVPRSKGKGKGKARATEDSLERARETKLSMKAREIREWMKGKSGSEMHHSAMDAIKNLAMGNDETISSAKVRQTVGGVRDLFKGRASRPGPPLRDRGPKPGQTYEIVDQRIIEKNPERTVEISTWREQVAKKAQTNVDERMSIYFLSADEYPQEGEYAANGTVEKVEWRIDGPDIPPEGMDYTQSGGVIADISRNMDKPPQLQQSLSANLEQQSPALRQEVLSLGTSEKDPSSSTKGNKENHIIEVTVEHVDIATGSSTSVKRSNQCAPRQRRQYYRPTPIDKELPRPPHDHTRSGSTVSTAKSNSANQFEAILQSCEPSLAHIAPVLRNLGIQQMEHLKAIAKLTPWIRDQEVKENALRLGVTVIEWAILLDKLSTL